MKRDLSKLSQSEYDVLIIGGGIYGAWAAWEATLRGMSVALLEKDDFGSATSANSLKIIHGGLRYLQHGDLKRMRASIHERSAYMKVAPHLVHPLPILIPTYGHGLRGKEVLSFALMLNDLVGCGRNRGKDVQKHIPRGYSIGKKEVLEYTPGISERGLTGGVVFYDAQVNNSERFLLSILHSAVNAGALACNYVKVTQLRVEGNRITGVEALDALTGERFHVRARVVVNSSGPWVFRLLSSLNGHRRDHEPSFSKAINLVTRPLFKKYAVGIMAQNQYEDRDKIMNKGGSYLFIAPWRDHSIVGTSYSTYHGSPTGFRVTEEDLDSFIKEINRACPSIALDRKDVSFVHRGLLPMAGPFHNAEDIHLLKHHRILNHAREGLKGLFSVIGVKYTMARYVGEAVVDLIFESWGKKPPRSKTSVTPLHGGQIEDLNAFVSSTVKSNAGGLPSPVVKDLIGNYGTAYGDILKHREFSPEDKGDGGDFRSVLKARVLYGVREEAALRLGDVIFRRTELGTAGFPGNEAIELCARTMGRELGWNQEITNEQIQEVNAAYHVTS